MNKFSVNVNLIFVCFLPLVSSVVVNIIVESIRSSLYGDTKYWFGWGLIIIGLLFSVIGCLIILHIYGQINENIKTQLFFMLVVFLASAGVSMFLKGIFIARIVDFLS